MKRKIRLTESDLHRIVKESVKRVLKESKGLEPGKRDKEFASRIKWGGEPDLDKANEWRKSQHYSSRGKKKVKGDTSTLDLFRRENGKGNFVHKLKTNQDEWVKNMCKESLKESGFNDNGLDYEFYVAADSDSDYFNDYDEAYKYAYSIAKESYESDGFDMESVHLMDNQEWQSIVIFDHKGIHDLENGTFTPW